ncbi:MAG: 2-amino-4-oxopentanoate thiolase subunit OrtA [Erysipelotrichaceae bacterium]|nr:2-amino-4-oxopentanoate thiolase subunit OrtA [Erysipelotrichaceae bacterium]MDP3306129.1 2-amino-4-oxopentanoate thiolase subunit OrtA [Erysipelotrichaceae bacterium]
MLALKGDWILIEQIFLTSDQRQSNVPIDTKQTDFRLRIKGFLVDEKCVVGDDCTISTKTGRVIFGKLIDIMPNYDHSFGDYVVETVYIENQLRKMLSGGSNE